MSALRQRALALAERNFRDHPRLLLPYYRLFGNANQRRRVLNRHSEIVIEGYPRSANTYTTVAFRMAQARKVSIAHHLHAPAHIRAGVARGVPVLVLMRAPRPAIESLAVMHPDAAGDSLIHRWLSFYEVVDALKEGLVLGRFDLVTTDLNRVIDLLNNRFGTAFKGFENLEQGTRRARKRLSNLHDLNHKEAIREDPLPNEAKEAEKARLRSLLSDELMARAEALHARLEAWVHEQEARDWRR